MASKRQHQKSTVFILGAGASFAGGAPLMSTFLQIAENHYLDGQTTWANDYFESVFNARKELLAAFAKTQIELDNIETLFSTFEMAAVVEQLGSLSKAEVASLPNALRKCILRTIELSLKYELHANEKWVRSPRPYDAFAKLVELVHQHTRFGPVTILTFNYDLALDYALTRLGVPFSYGLNDSSPPADEILVLKPHGSLNWIRGQDGQIIAEPVHVLDADYYWRHLGVSKHDTRRIAIETVDFLRAEREWGAQMQPPPYLVPPTWNKAEHQVQLRSIWKLVIHSLARANNLFVSGYSLPASDQFFRSVFALGMLSTSMIDNFVVFDPGEVDTSWRTLCGSSIRDRNRFRHERTTFEGSIAWIINQFDLQGSEVTRLLRT